LRGFGVGFFPSAINRSLKLVEAAEREVDLATHFEQRWRRLTGGELHAHRDRFDRAHVRRDVLSQPAVPACRAAHEDSVLVDEVDRKPSIFGSVTYATSLVPSRLHTSWCHFSSASSVVTFSSEPIGREVRDLLELVRRRCAHALRWRARGRQLRIRLLDGGELVVEAVVLGVRDSGSSRTW